MVLDKAIVIGNGPSLTGKPLDDWIGGCDIVIRLSNNRAGKSDYFMYVWQDADVLGRADLSQLKEFWFYRTPKRGAETTEDEWAGYEDVVREHYDGKITHMNAAIKRWLDMYKEIAKPLNQKNHPHVRHPGKGTAAALMAMETLSLSQLLLVGLDNVFSGQRTYHCHDFAAENQVLREASKALGVELLWNYP